MINNKHKWVNIFFFCLLLTAYCLLFTSCGRRGDPVWVEPREEKSVGSDKVKSDEGKEEKTPELREKTEQPKLQITVPDPPTGLAGVYTQQSIVLVWNETVGSNIKYKIYRSAGADYVLVGETVTPAFTDREVEPNKKYIYRISAAGVTEGGPSKEITIITEVH